MNINKNYIQRFKEVASLLLDEYPPDEFIVEWYSHSSETLQDFFANHLNVTWMTGIDAIEAVENVIEGACDNYNLREDWSIV